MQGINGYLERKSSDRYRGEMEIDGVALGSIDGVYFREGGKMLLWLKRSPVVEYDDKERKFKKRRSEPAWEVVLEPMPKNDAANYRGEFIFLRFRYSIIGIWDEVWKDRYRINFYVERLPMSQQTIIQGISARNNKQIKRRE